VFVSDTWSASQGLLKEHKYRKMLRHETSQDRC